MLIDIHRHSPDPGQANIMLRNLYPSEFNQVQDKGYFSIGLHPWHVDSSDIYAGMDTVQKASRINEVIAIGETGLDKGIDTDIQLQRKVFQLHIDIAKEAEKPIVIHCVKAYAELLKFRKESKHHQPWIIHWFNASPEMGKDLIGKNCFLSFGISLFKNNSKAQRSFMDVPLENIFLETDDASVTIKEVYKKAADLKKIDLPQLISKIQNNFFHCFGINLKNPVA